MPNSFAAAARMGSATACVLLLLSLNGAATQAPCYDTKSAAFCQIQLRNCQISPRVRNKCPQTCSVCVDGKYPRATVCEDQRATAKCLRKQRKGKCSKSAVASSCALSCNRCQPVNGGAGPVVPAAPVCNCDLYMDGASECVCQLSLSKKDSWPPSLSVY